MKPRIITKNRDIYNILKSLKFQNEVTIDKKCMNFKKIVNSINRKEKQVLLESKDNKHILKKISPKKPLNFEIYLR